MFGGYCQCAAFIVLFYHYFNPSIRHSVSLSLPQSPCICHVLFPVSSPVSYNVSLCGPGSPVMSKLSSGFLGAEAAAGASSAFESALQDLKEKYERKAEEEAAAPKPAAAAAAAEAGAASGGVEESKKPDGEGSDSEDDWLDDPELDKIRQQRLLELKEKQSKRKEHLSLGHGEYRCVCVHRCRCRCRCPCRCRCRCRCPCRCPCRCCRCRCVCLSLLHIILC